MDSSTPAPTMADVARLAGVSKKTVSNALSGYPYMKTETRERVEAAIAQLNYRVNVSARTLRTGRTGTIAFVIPELHQPFFSQLAAELIAVAEEAQLSVQLRITGGSIQNERAVLTSTSRHQVDGVICFALGLNAYDLGSLSIDVPMVLLGDRDFQSPFDQVIMDAEAPARAAVSHLIEGGRRRIALLGAAPAGRPGAPSTRATGALHAIREAGLKLDQRLVPAVAPGWTMERGAAAMTDLLDSAVSFDGVFCFADVLAFGALAALRVRGRRVPDDVAVVGYDDVEYAGFSAPTLTSVDHGRAQMARDAVALLTDRLSADARTSNARNPNPRTIVEPFELRIRESSGPPRPASADD